VAAAFADRVEDDLPLRRHPKAAFPHQSGVVHRVVCHAMIRYCKEMQ
jgi:hypothetical protein